MTSIHIRITGQDYNVPCSAAGLGKLCKLLKFVFDLRDFFSKIRECSSEVKCLPDVLITTDNKVIIIKSFHS